MLGANFFTKNRKKLLEHIGDELIIVTANGLMQRSSDTVFPFRQESNFYYLTGITEPDAVLVLSQKEEFLILPKRSQTETIFGGAINCDEIANISGITTVCEYREGWERYKKMQKSRKKIYTLLPPPEKILYTDSFFSNPARRRLVRRLKRLSTDIIFEDIRYYLTQMRQIKQPEEIAAIKQAIEVTAEGLAQSIARIKSGISGHVLKAELDHTFAQYGADHAFAPIVISGPDTSVIHSTNLARIIQNDEPILYDIGAEVDLYGADIARTYPSTEWTKRQAELYRIVVKMRNDMMGFLKAGTSWKEYAQRADQLLGEELIRLGLIKENKRELVRPFFPHAIGHSLGLDVHDLCDYGTIQEGMVITVEPGIYIPEEGIGIRIEDDVLVTRHGVENLSVQVPLP